MIDSDKCLHSQKDRRKIKNKFIITKPVHLAHLLLDTYLRSFIVTLTSFRLVHGTSLETCEPRKYYTSSKLYSLGVTTRYKTRDI